MPGEVAPPPVAPPPNGAPPPAKAGNGVPPVAPPPVADPFDTLLKGTPFAVKNRAGKEVKITSRQQLEHYVGKGFGSHEAFEENNRLKEELRTRDEVFRRIEAGDDVSVETLRKALGPKWKTIVQKEALRDFDEEERLKNIPPEIREKLEEARRLREEKTQREAQDQQTAAERKRAAEQAQLKEIHEEVQRIGIPALQKAGFPERPPAPVIFRLANYMAENVDLARERGVAELPVDVVAEAVRDDMQAEHLAITKGFVSAGDFNGAVKWLGEDFINFLRKNDLARLRGGGAPVPAKSPTEAPVKKEDDLKFWR